MPPMFRRRIFPGRLTLDFCAAYGVANAGTGFMNLIELLEATASRLPQKPALIDDSTVVTYRDLVEQVAAFAGQLGALKLSPRARVGLCYPNSIDYVALTFALW